MPADLTPLIAATAQWLTRAYPSDGGALASALSEAQARQAVTVAAWLRYPTEMDAALVAVAGPGGSTRLDGITGREPTETETDIAGHAWRTWVDEVVASWAACLLSAPLLARAAVNALAGGSHTVGSPVEFRRLLTPDEGDQRAAVLLRHPDLTAPIAELHHAQLLALLTPGTRSVPD
ncbi:hypothetical protein ACIHCQ_23480 [Streptomyces sp. NPDC052236]|uniref:hypothetical protein n=1 Tax=Streptomyces sp. NPDC052236 TaxID=3365686 RepID=UPI0037D0DF32